MTNEAKWRKLVKDIQFDLPENETRDIIIRDIQTSVFPNLMSSVINEEPDNRTRGALVEIKNLITSKKVPLFFPEQDDEFPTEALLHMVHLRHLYLQKGMIGLRIYVFPASFERLKSLDDRPGSVERVRQIMYDVYRAYKQLTAQRLFMPGDSQGQ